MRIHRQRKSNPEACSATDQLDHRKSITSYSLDFASLHSITDNTSNLDNSELSMMAENEVNDGGCKIIVGRECDKIAENTVPAPLSEGETEKLLVQATIHEKDGKDVETTTTEPMTSSYATSLIGDYGDDDSWGDSPFHVRFSEVEIREYPIIIGDNPAVARGAPLTISWNYEGLYKFPIEDYERLHPPKRGQLELKQESLDRLHLLKRLGYSREEINEAIKNVNQARYRRQRTLEMMKLCYAEELIEKIRRFIVNQTVRRGQKKKERELLHELCEQDHSTASSSRFTVETVDEALDEISEHSSHVDMAGKVLKRLGSSCSNSDHHKAAEKPKMKHPHSLALRQKTKGHSRKKSWSKIPKAA